ncbi:hypothetical protein HD597_004021 [Nonomuraea thailandensis]|uniref:Uncharacterized protein n=1 Tax=Nonomuraea thailandensis TaxID=1188745 RepID=A0A9X2GK72_9ACTN|nr:hypothetical protein [Nonomuraea thailandensis]MCP2357001.1 hypothetical protein [Nonomuraea thailandensis]
MGLSGKDRDAGAAFSAAEQHPLKDRLTVNRAGHAKAPAYSELLRLCLDSMIDISGPHCLMYFNGGFRDFTIDLFDHPEVSDPDAAGTLREKCVRAFRRFILVYERMEWLLDPLRTGGLIRIALRTGTGLIVCGRVRAEEYIVGMSSPVRAPDRVDWRLCELITAIRTGLYELPDENPGGYHGRRSESAQSAEITFRRAPDASPSVQELLKEQLNVNDLHYVALIRDRQPVMEADVFNSSAVSHLFNSITTAHRRTLYGEFAHRGRGDLAHLHRAVRDIIGGPAERVVLDLESGAIYVERLGSSNDLLLGVTLEQSAVESCDGRIARLRGQLKDTPET